MNTTPLCRRVLYGPECMYLHIHNEHVGQYKTHKKNIISELQIQTGYFAALNVNTIFEIALLTGKNPLNNTDLLSKQ